MSFLIRLDQSRGGHKQTRDNRCHWRMIHAFTAAIVARRNTGDALELSAVCSLRPRLGRACWLSPAKFNCLESTTSMHVFGMRQHLQCSTTRVTEVQIAPEQSCIILCAFLVLPPMLPSAPLGEHGEVSGHRKTFSRPSTTTANWLTHNCSPPAHSIKDV